MPGLGAEFAGVKVLTMSAGNAAVGLPKIQGVYVLFDARTLAPVACLDAAELTLLRTSAMTALAVKYILAADPHRLGPDGETPGPSRLVIFGTGPQAWRHIEAVAEIAEAVVVGRTAAKIASVVETCNASGITARGGTVSEVGDADIVVCVTSSTTPLFEGKLVQPHAVVAAIGSHGLDAREVDPELARLADVVVEARASAMRESGDLIPARSAEEWALEQIVNVSELVRGGLVRSRERPTLYTGVGMAWQDLAVASAIYNQGLG